MTHRYPWILALAALATGCGGGATDDYPDDDKPGAAAAYTLTPAATGDGWTVSTPGAEGFDAQALAATFQAIRGGDFPGVDSMVVVRHQRLVAEGYFNGYDRDTVHDLRSTGKSFVSTLAGIALSQGLLSLDDPVAQHVPDFERHQNMDDRKRAITLRHLLNMSSGLDCDDWNEGSPGWEERMYDSPDWIAFVLDLRMAAAPGTQSRYCTAGVVLLGHVVSLRSGQALDAYAQQRLLAPLDIQESRWRRAPDGSTTGGTGFGLRPRDAAKLGALFASQGVWNGTRLVPESWIALASQRVTTLGNQDYGYLWWKRRFQHGSVQVDALYAAGNGGNHVFVVPSLDLVVAFTGSNYNSPRSELPHDIMPRVLAALP